MLLLCVWTVALLLSVGTNAQTPGPSPEAAPVVVGERTVLKFSQPLRGLSPRDRATQANKELQGAVVGAVPLEVKQRSDGSSIVVYIGDRPVFTLTSDDATAADQDSLQVYADTVCITLTEVIAAEQQRTRIAKRAFSASLVVFFGLVAILLLRRVGELGERARKWAEERGDTLTLRVLQFELVRPEMVQSTAVIAVTLCTWFVRVGVVYAWLAVTLSLFEVTRGYTGKLANLVLSPVSDLASRLALTLPVLVVAIVAAIATWVVVRFVGLLFASVARRETHLAWVAPELAMPTSVLLRVAIVVSALAFVAPAVTGSPEGSVARTGMMALLAFALAAVPVLASATVGAVYLFGRRLPIGMYISVGNQRGRLQHVTFLELRLLTERGDELHVPSLYLLRAPLTVLGSTAIGCVTLTIESDKPTAEVKQMIAEVAAKVTLDSRVTLVSFEAHQRRFEVRGRLLPATGSTLLSTLVEELVALGLNVTSGHGETNSHAAGVGS